MRHFVSASLALVLVLAMTSSASAGGLFGGKRRAQACQVQVPMMSAGCQIQAPTFGYPVQSAPSAASVVPVVPTGQVPGYAAQQAVAAVGGAGGCSGSAASFLGWLNATRASYGLSAVGYDPNLEAWAAQNSAQQAVSGIGHFVMGPARRQNSAMGGFPGIESMWMASPAHRAALLDPTITRIGLAAYGMYWTFNGS